MSDKEEREAQSLVEALPERLREGGPLPLGYYLMRQLGAKDIPQERGAQSTFYHAESIDCLPFHKPISRCFRVEE